MRRILQALTFSLLCILLFQLNAQAAQNKAEVAPGSANPAPVAWPTAPADPNACTTNCGGWTPYTMQSDTLNDPRVQDPSNGGTSPQNYVNVSSGCTDKSLPSVYYAFDHANNVLFFRWRVEQIANTYATGPNAGSYSSSDPWNSALWTVLIDIDGDGFREFAVHLDGSSGSPGNAIDSLAAIYSNTPSQSIDYINDPSITLLNQKPTAFVSGGKIANYQSSNTPVYSWPNGSSETVWDYGSTRATKILNSCNEFFIDYQIPLTLLNATAVGGPQVTTNTPIALFFSTANSLNNPAQKDAVLNGDVVFVGDPNKQLPFGDTITPAGGVLSQPVIESVAAASCADASLTALVKDALKLDGTTSVNAVEFFQYYDANADGQDNDSSTWTSIGAAANSGGQNWAYSWDSTNLAKGQYLIGAKATDAQGNVTWSYLDENEATALGASNYANPAPTPGVVVTTFLNTCGVSPRLVKTASAAEVVTGQTVTFTLTVENPTADPLSLTAITDTLPAGFTFMATTGGTLAPTSSPSNGSSGDIVWAFAPQVIAANGGTGTLIFTATAPSVVGTYTNNAAMSTAQGLYDSNPLQIGVGAARLTLAKTANLISADPGDPITYTITYANDSPVNVSNVVISDVIPLGLDNVTPLDGGVLAGGTITWNVGDLASGTGAFSVRFAATVSDPYPGGAAAPLVNTATIDSDQTDQVGASATTGINVPRPKLVIQKSADTSLVIPGGQVVFTLSYENVGNVPATGVVITDTLPAGFNFVAASNGGSHSGGIVTWTIGNVAALTSGFVTLTAAADTPFVDTNPAVNTAGIDSAETSPISDTFSVGVTQSGGSCTIYYFHDETIPSTVLQDVAKTATPTGSLVIPTNVAPAANTEYARFYLNPALTQNLNLSSSNSVTTTLYLYKESGMAANVRVLLYKNDSTAGNLIGEGVRALGNSALGSNTVPVANEVTVTITGTHSLGSGDRLLWVVQGEKTGSAGVKELGIGYNSAAAASNSSVCASPAPALTVDKVASKQAASPAETLIYTITFANQGGTTTGAVITDTLPSGVSFVSASHNGASITPSGSAPDYVFTVNTDDTATSGQVSGGESGMLVITATVDQPLSNAITTLTNGVDFSADGATPVDDTATSTVVRPELTIAKSVDKSLLIPGDEATYTLVVLNSGDGAAANVTISDTLPSTAYFSYVAGSTRVDSSPVADPVSGNLFTLNIGSLAAGASKTVTFKMQVANNGSAPDGITTLSNQAAVTSDQTNSSPSQIVDVSISTNANLQISKSSAVDPALSAGDSITYTLRVTNTGTSTAQNVRVSDPIVSNGSYVAGTLQVENAAQTDAADGDAGQFDVINNRILVTVGDLAPNAARTIQFRVQIDDVLAAGTTPITNTATVNAGNAAARNAQRVDNASAAPQLSIDKSGPSTAPFPAARLTAAATAATSLAVDSSALLGVGQYVRINGQIARIVSINGTTVVVDTAITAANGADVAVSFSYAITYANEGTAAATGVVVTDTLPASTVFVTATNGGSHASGIVTWTVGTLQPGDTGSALVVVIPTQAGDAVNQAEIGADDVSPVSDSVTTGVGGLLLRKHTTTPVVNQTLSGAQAIYVIEVENTSSSAANGVIVTDTLASGFTFLSTGGISGGTLTSPTPTVGSAQPAWGAFSIAANSTLLITFTAAIGDEVGAAVYQNEVAVSSTNLPVTPFDPLRTPDEDVQVIVPNVVLSKSVDPNNVYSGEVVTYTVVAVNDGDAVATGVRISDTLPAGFSYAGVTISGADVSGQVTRTTTLDPSNGATVPSWGAWSIAPAATLTVTFQVTATTNSGVFSNTVSATSDNSVIRTITDTAPVTVTALTSADLSLSKLATPDPVTAGEVVTYTLVVSNSGPAAATGVTITDTLPVSVSFGSATPGCTENSGVVVCSVGSLTVNGSATFTIAVTVDSSVSGSISNSAVVAGNEDDPNPSNNSDNADVTVNPPASPNADLSLTISVNNPTPNVGDNIVFTLVLTNSGPSAASGVTVSETLPSGYVLVGSSATVGSYNGSSLWTVGALTSGQSVTLTITATVQASGTYTNYVEVNAADQPDVDSTPGNSSTSEDDDDSVSVTPSTVADLSLDISVDNPTPNVGDNIVFTLVLTNGGPSAATGVTVSNTLPSGYSWYSSSATLGSYDGVDLWSIGAVASGQVVTLTITATVQATGDYNSYAEVATSSQPDSDSTPANSSSSEDDDDQVAVTPTVVADLSLDISVNNPTPNVGDNIVFTLVLTNDGPSAASSVTVSNTLPSGYSWYSSSATLGSYDGVDLWSIGAVASGQVVTLTITATVQATGDYNSYAEVATSSQPDSDSTPANSSNTEDDDDQVAVTPTVVADLSLDISVNNPTPNVGDNIVFTLVLTNSGPSAASGVTVSNTLPSGYSWYSSSATLGSYDGVDLWSIGAVASGQVVTLTITATVQATGDYNSYAEVATSSQPDSDSTPANSSSSEDDDDQVAVTPTVVADLSLTISVNNPTPNVGDNIVFTLVLTNDGPSAASSVTVSNTLPSGYSWYSSSATLGSYNGVDLWSIGSVASGQVVTLTTSATVQATGLYNSYAEVATSSQPDSDSTPANSSSNEDDDDQVAVTPTVVADLSLDISVNNPTPNVGDNIVFTLVLTNSGPSAASGVTVSNTLPSGYSWYSSSATLGSYNGVDLWSIGSVASGQVVTLTITATVQATGLYNSYAEVATSSQPDSDSTPANNSSSEDDDDQVAVTPTAQDGVLGGWIWEDSSGDGIQSNGENGINGVEVKLYDQNNDLITSTTTDANGNYTFTVPAGDYRIVVSAANGYDFTFVNEGSDDNNDSDVDPFNGEFQPLTINAGNSNQPVDAGLYIPAVIGDNVWFDYNGNGVIDQGEPGISGVVVQIATPPGRARSLFDATTTAGGGYFLGPLRPGSYPVAVDLSTLPAGLKATFDLDGQGDSTATANLVSGQDNLNLDFGFNGDPRFEATKTAVRLVDADSNNATSPGDTLRYTVMITNRGYAHATGVRFDDTPGRYTSLVGGSVTTTQGTIERGNGATDRQIAVNIGALPVGAAVTITFDVRIASTVPADVVQVANQGVVSSNEVPSTPTDDPATRTPDEPTLTPIKSEPALVLTKQVTLDTDVDGNNRPNAGDTLRYTITVKNNGGGTAQALVLTDTPDANTTLVVGSVTATQGNVSSGNTAGDSSVAVNVGDLAGGATMEIIYKVTINSPLPRDLKVLRNQATVNGSNVPPTVSDDPMTPTGDDPTGTYISNVVALDAFKEAQLYTDADNNSQPSPGDTLIYHVTVLNMGVAVAPAVSFTDTPDANTSLVAGSVKTTQGVVVTGNGGGDSSVAVNIGDVAAQSAVIVTFRVRINAPLPDTVKEVSNQGVVSSSSTNCDTPTGSCTIATDDPVTRDGDDPTVTGLLQSPAMTLSKRYVGPAAIKLGDILTYTIRITNTGNTILTQVPLTDSFTTAYINFVDAVPAADVVNEPNGTARWHDLTTVFGDLLPGESFTVTTWMRASAVTPNGTAAVNEATVANVEDEFGQLLPAGQQRDNLFFGVAPSLLVSKEVVAPVHAEVGQEITYSIRITNIGNSLIVTLPLSDVYESQVLNFVRAQPAPSRQQPGNAEWLDLTDQFGDLVPGASVEVLAVFTASQAVSNTVNLAQVIGAVDVQGIAAHGNASKNVEVAAPTAVTLLSFTATAQGNALRVAWVTGAEINSWGFHLWRSQSERRDEAVRVTGQMIPALGSTTQGAAYHYIDTGVVAGERYFYWLEETEVTDKRHEYGPILAKWTADGGEIEATPRLYLPWITAP